jgi:alkylhydroperoxidase/carboxymuconolactone decarboxylase family protein YurZ
MSQTIDSVSLEEVRSAALELLDGADEGERLDELTAALIALAVRASVTALDVDGTRAYAERALDLGATPEQVHETLMLVSGLGIHTLMEGSRCVADVLRSRGQGLSAPLDKHRACLWDRHVGSDPYWDTFEPQVPGFLDALLRLSPEAFEAFFAYCAVPWRTGALRAVTKELISIAADATPTHRYLPGLRLHVTNAVAVGAGRAAILETLDIAAAAPIHRGVR